eukprot:CAMPEP_0176216686 /NCGR_PEP_ID=MMETSP0121_2-20121125/17313_1 /TAXON_ID=160619 /ORGANISM="Kryptoperidinium foliaceum, Strain CCMP 1326" /LENGTH=119 /DNA_ID=CAMNT_0017555809 /DNA_START=12 /DNA_END=371 /DNA_ORIENTATION=+
MGLSDAAVSAEGVSGVGAMKMMARDALLGFSGAAVVWFFWSHGVRSARVLPPQTVQLQMQINEHLQHRHLDTDMERDLVQLQRSQLWHTQVGGQQSERVDQQMDEPVQVLPDQPQHFTL